MKKSCSKCEAEKSLDDFPVSKRHRFCKHSICKACTKVRSDAWYRANAARKLAAGRRWAALNPERAAEISRRSDIAWRSRNAVKDAERAARRRALIRRAIPGWASREAIEAFYADAAKLSAETGIAHEVDHIVPLQSPLVCGLHCESNLRVIPARENMSKRNLHWPGMP